jgi:hypothetical protein
LASEIVVDYLLVGTYTFQWVSYSLQSPVEKRGV